MSSSPNLREYDWSKVHTSVLVGSQGFHRVLTQIGWHLQARPSLPGEDVWISGSHAIDVANFRLADSIGGHAYFSLSRRFSFADLWDTGVGSYFLLGQLRAKCGRLQS